MFDILSDSQLFKAYHTPWNNSHTYYFEGHEGVLGSGVTVPRILDLGTRWM